MTSRPSKPDKDQQLLIYAREEARKYAPDMYDKGIERIARASVIAIKLTKTYDKIRDETFGSEIVINPFELLNEKHYAMIDGGYIMIQAFKHYLEHLQSVFGEEQIGIPQGLDETAEFLLRWLVAYEEGREGMA